MAGARGKLLADEEQLHDEATRRVGEQLVVGGRPRLECPLNEETGPRTRHLNDQLLVDGGSGAQQQLGAFRPVVIYGAQLEGSLSGVKYSGVVQHLGVWGDATLEQLPHGIDASLLGLMSVG